jgi:ADP-ribose pyrophosphatase YjhB (NUDIX family)
VEYSNPAPTVSVTIVRDGKYLLAKRAVEPHKGTWDILGGFIEAGESAEEAAVRELKEEIGLNTQVKAYLGTTWDTYAGQPSMIVMFLMETLDEKQPAAADDVEALEWFSLDAPMPEPIAFRNVRITIEKAREYLLGKENT